MTAEPKINAEIIAFFIDSSLVRSFRFDASTGRPEV
jgi:hypothetical protein